MTRGGHETRAMPQLQLATWRDYKILNWQLHTDIVIRVRKLEATCDVSCGSGPPELPRPIAWTDAWTNILSY